MSHTELAPLVCSIEVNCTQAEAFDLWTGKPTTWWPVVGHSAFENEIRSIVIEPHADGRIFETSNSGEVREWGAVTAWRPPNRLAFSWHIYGSSQDATAVSVTFEPIADGRSKVTVIHTGWDKLGERAGSIRGRNRQGWTDVLNAFSTSVSGGDHSR